MSKSLKAVYEERCVGCEICVMECQKQFKRAGLEGSLIRILRNTRNGTRFEVSVDPGVEEIKTSRIVTICPRGVFEEVEES